MNDLQARQNASEDRVLLVQPRCSRSCNEELGTVGVWTGIGHTDGVGPGEGVIRNDCSLEVE